MEGQADAAENEERCSSCATVDALEDSQPKRYKLPNGAEVDYWQAWLVMYTNSLLVSPWPAIEIFLQHKERHWVIISQTPDLTVDYLRCMVPCHFPERSILLVGSMQLALGTRSVFSFARKSSCAIYVQKRTKSSFKLEIRSIITFHLYVLPWWDFDHVRQQVAFNLNVQQHRLAFCTLQGHPIFGTSTCREHRVRSAAVVAHLY